MRFKDSNAPAQRWCGFTLVEVLIATAVSGIVMWGVIATNLHLARSGVRITHYTEMDSQIRQALDRLGAHARMATAIKWNGVSDITFTVPTLGGGTTQVTYAWTAATQSFFSVPGASSAVTTGRIRLVRGMPALAGGAPGVAFARFDRSGNAATTDLATKRIQVSLTASRAPTAAATATREVISASFTLRNKPVK